MKELTKTVKDAADKSEKKDEAKALKDEVKKVESNTATIDEVDINVTKAKKLEACLIIF